jgi:hypothetical protein
MSVAFISSASPQAPPLTPRRKKAGNRPRAERHRNGPNIVPSWELWPAGRDATERELAAIGSRGRRNLLEYMRNPQEEYTVAEIAELLIERPEKTAALLEARGWPANRTTGAYRREYVSLLLLSGDVGPYLPTDLAYVINEGAVPGWLERTAVSEQQATAIRRFFSSRQEEYTAGDVEPLGIPDDAMFEATGEPSRDHADVADYLAAYVSPVIVARCVSTLPAFPAALALTTVAIELPAWLLDALQSIATKRRESISDVISFELMNCVEVGTTCDLDEAMAPRISEYRSALKCRVV